MRNPYQAPEAQQVSLVDAPIDLSSEWSIELALGQALTLAGRRGGLLALLASGPAALGVLNLGLNHLMARFMADGEPRGLVLAGASVLGLMASGIFALALRLVLIRVWLAMVRSEAVVWWSLGRFAILFILFIAGQTLYSFVSVFAMLFVVPLLVLLACTHVWTYCLVDGDDLVEAFQNSWP